MEKTDETGGRASDDAALFSKNALIIGLDDTDSNEGMCTTWLAALLAEELGAYGRPIGFPHLVRLNPTIPYKTRGNAALGLLFETDPTVPDVFEKIKAHVCARIDRYARTDCDKTNPGAVFIPASLFGTVRERLGSHLKKAVTDVVSIEEAKSLATDCGIPRYYLKNGRGLIGALAAAGAILDPGNDKTYEYLAYRRPENFGKKRQVSTESLLLADAETFPDTWDTVDRSGKSKPFPVCVPGSPDPVLYGIRGKSPAAVKKAAAFIESEPVDRFCIFETNQGTDAHLIDAARFADMRPYHSYRVSGIVVDAARTIEGGHDIFRIGDNCGETLSCAAYEPTGHFRKIVRQLMPGDTVTVFGSLKEENDAAVPETDRRTLNLEKIKIEETVPIVRYENPACPRCGKKTESAGKDQGFRCRKCRTVAAEKTKITDDRQHLRGFYEVPPSARRHLSKPLIREKTANERQDIPVYPSV